MNTSAIKISKKTLSIMLAILMVFAAIPIYAFAATTSHTATFEVGESKTSFTYEESAAAPSDYTVATLAAEAGFEIPALNADEYQGWSVNGVSVNLSEYELPVGETTFTAIPIPVLVIEEETTPTPPPGPQTTENEGTLETSEAPAVIATFLKDDGTVLDTVALDAEGKPVDALPTTITQYVASPYISIQNGVEVTIPATLKAWEVKGTEISIPVPLSADSFSSITASVSLSPVVDYIIEDITEDGTPQYDIESIYTVNYYVQSAAATIPNSTSTSGAVSYTVSFQYPTGQNEYALANSIEYIDVVGKTIEASTFSASIPSWLGEAAGFTVNSALSTTGNVVIDGAGTQAINIYINRNASTITLRNYSKDGNFTPRTVTYNNVRYGTDLSVVNRDPHNWDQGQPVYQRYMWSTTARLTAQEAALLPNTMPSSNIALYEIVQQDGTVKYLTINAYKQEVGGFYLQFPTKNLVNGQVFTIYNNNYTTVRDTYDSAINSIVSEGYEIDNSLNHTPSADSLVTAFTNLAQNGTHIANVYYKVPALRDVFFINATGFVESNFNKKYDTDSSAAINIPASELINPKPGKVFAGWKIQGSADSTAVEAPEKITIPSGLGPLYITAVWKDAEIIPMDPANAWFNVSSNNYVYNGLDHLFPGAKETNNKPAGATITFSYSVDGEPYGNLPKFTDVKRDSSDNVIPYIVKVKAHVNGSVKIGDVEHAYADTVVTLNVYVYPANLTITANSDSKAYDGAPLTNAGYSNSVLPIGVSRVVAVVKGSQTEVGSSANKVTDYTILKGDKDVTANFTLAILNDGTLTVTSNPAVITITANSDSKAYDGTELTNDGFSASTLPTGVTAVTAVVKGSITDPGTESNVVTSYQLFNGDKDVTKYFTNVNLVAGELTIFEELYIEDLIVADQTKVYGNNDPANAISGLPAGFVAGVDYTIVFDRVSGEDVGDYEIYVSELELLNPKYRFAGETADITSGTLTITPRPVILTVSGATKVVDTADDFSGVSAIFNDDLAKGAFVISSIGRDYNRNEETVGTHLEVITAYFFSNSNFTVTIEKGTLTITEAAIVPPIVIPPVVIPPVVPVVPAAPAPDAPAIIPNPDIPLAPTTITDTETPLAQPISASWALINLILAIVAVLYAIYLAVGYRKSREGDKAETDAYGNKSEDTRGKRGIIWRSIAVILGIVAPVVFLLTEDITLPIAFVDSWTLLMAVFVVAQIVSAVVLHQSRKAQEQGQTQSTAY